MSRAYFWRLTSACIVVLLTAGRSPGFQKGAKAVTSKSAAPSEFDFSSSELRPLLGAFSADRQALARFYNVEDSPERRERFRKFNSDWLARLLL